MQQHNESSMDATLRNIRTAPLCVACIGRAVGLNATHTGLLASAQARPTETVVRAGSSAPSDLKPIDPAAAFDAEQGSGGSGKANRPKRTGSCRMGKQPERGRTGENESFLSPRIDSATCDLRGERGRSAGR